MKREDGKLRYFTLEEFKCSHTGLCLMDESSLFLFDELRDRCGFPFSVTSGYRDPSHPSEARKDKPGEHSRGTAMDVAVSGGRQRRILVQQAIQMGVFGGIGVAKTFVHVDTRTSGQVLWTYT